ncbi:hypothetical protein FDUTEX481_08332 [Tolypothrix sp. PCC 7601]|nr:hypothetical protein FDUTEX481_08332 [Tolypothrix sp. PCC 7601]
MGGFLYGNEKCSLSHNRPFQFLHTSKTPSAKTLTTSAVNNDLNAKSIIL